MEKVVVYLLNNKNNYLKMAINSISMLRKYNKSIKVICLTTEPIPFPKNLNVEIILINNIDTNYFLSNKVYISNLEYASVLYIDSDTFIFDDVEKIFQDNYEFDFYGCENNWAYKLNFNEFKPVNGGVLLFNNYSHKKIYEDFNFKLKNLSKLYPKINRWIKDVNNDWVVEEFLTSAIVHEEKIPFAFFNKNQVKLIEEIKDVYNFETIIFHTFTSNWEIVRRKTNNKNIKIFKKYKKFKESFF